MQKLQWVRRDMISRTKILRLRFSIHAKASEVCTNFLPEEQATIVFFMRITTVEYDVMLLIE